MICYLHCYLALKLCKEELCQSLPVSLQAGGDLIINHCEQDREDILEDAAYGILVSLDGKAAEPDRVLASALCRGGAFVRSRSVGGRREDSGGELDVGTGRFSRPM